MSRKSNPKKPPHGYDYDRPEAADFVGERPATLADKACRGEGPPFVVAGGRAWYKRGDLERYLKSRLRGPSDRSVA